MRKLQKGPAYIGSFKMQLFLTHLVLGCCLGWGGGQSPMHTPLATPLQLEAKYILSNRLTYVIVQV